MRKISRRQKENRTKIRKIIIQILKKLLQS